MKAGIVWADFNFRYTEAIKSAAVDYLRQNEVKDIVEFKVPGAFELGLGALHMIQNESCDFAVCIGVVIRGDTSHYDFVCKAAQEGCLNVSLQTGRPVGFGVLTVDTFEQLYDRIWGAKGNAGVHAASAALTMAKRLIKK
jgi:6,7-dimethyl-8-ribityllumazine synthase